MIRLFTSPKMLAHLTGFLIGFGGLAMAQDPPQNAITVELNTVAQSGQDCAVTFVLEQDLPHPIDALTVETVFFDQSDQVSLLTVFDFGQLPVSVPRVRRFLLAQTQCADLSRVLINGIGQCQIAGQQTPCAAPLTTRSRVDIELLG